MKNYEMYPKGSREWIALIGAEGVGIFKSEEDANLVRNRFSYIRNENVLLTRMEAKEWITNTLMNDGRRIRVVRGFPKGVNQILFFKDHGFFIKTKPIIKL